MIEQWSTSLFRRYIRCKVFLRDFARTGFLRASLCISFPMTISYIRSARWIFPFTATKLRFIVDFTLLSLHLKLASYKVEFLWSLLRFFKQNQYIQPRDVFESLHLSDRCLRNILFSILSLHDFQQHCVIGQWIYFNSDYQRIWNKNANILLKKIFSFIKRSLVREKLTYRAYRIRLKIDEAISRGKAAIIRDFTHISSGDNITLKAPPNGRLAFGRWFN